MLGSYLNRTRTSEVLAASRSELDISNPKAFREYLLKNGVTTVINTAGLVASENPGDPLQLYKVNALYVQYSGAG